MKWNDPEAKERFFAIGEELGAKGKTGLDRLWITHPPEMDAKEFDEAVAREIIGNMLPIINLLS